MDAEGGSMSGAGSLSQPGVSEWPGFYVLRALALLLEAALDRATMAPRELAQDRTHGNPACGRLLESALQFFGAASGLAGKARVDKRLAAGVRVCRRRRTTHPEYKREQRKYDEQ